MSARVVTLVIALVVAGGSATAAVARARHAETSSSMSHERDSLRAGPDSTRVAGLLTTLGTTDPLVCEMIADQIGNFWSDGDDDGIGRFTDVPNARAMRAAKDSLHGHIATAGAITVLTKTLGSDNACVRRVAGKLLGRSRIAADQLSRLLDDASPRVREAAAYAIGTGRVHPARDRLERLLASGSAPAAMAAWALGEIEDSASVPALEQALTSSDADVRLAVVDALGNIKEDRSLPALERALTRDANARVRVRAARAVGDIGHASSVAALSAAIDDSSPDVRYAAVHAFDDLHDLQTAPDALVKAARSGDERLRKVAGLALAEIHDPATLETLLTFVTFDDRDVRRKVAEALGEIGSPKASAGLMRLMKDADPEVRRAATEALGEINRER